MRHKVYSFLNNQRSPLADQYIDDCFCTKLAYISDIFDQLNQLNLSMQGRSSSLFLVADKIEGFKKMIDLWKKELTIRDMRCFHSSVKILKLPHMWIHLNK